MEPMMWLLVSRMGAVEIETSTIDPSLRCRCSGRPVNPRPPITVRLSVRNSSERKSGTSG